MMYVSFVSDGRALSRRWYLLLLLLAPAVSARLGPLAALGAHTITKLEGDRCRPRSGLGSLWLCFN